MPFFVCVPLNANEPLSRRGRGLYSSCFGYSTKQQNWRMSRSQNVKNCQ